MSLLPDTFAFIPEGDLKAWQGHVTEIASSKVIHTITFLGFLDSNGRIDLHTTSVNQDHIAHPSTLLVEFIIKKDKQRDYPGRHLWQISTVAPSDCVAHADFKSEDVRRIRIWQPKV